MMPYIAIALGAFILLWSAAFVLFVLDDAGQLSERPRLQKGVRVVRRNKGKAAISVATLGLAGLWLLSRRRRSRRAPDGAVEALEDFDRRRDDEAQDHEAVNGPLADADADASVALEAYETEVARRVSDIDEMSADEVAAEMDRIARGE